MTQRAGFGETPNLAARLQSLAEAKQVIIDNNTHRLLGELFEPTGREVKGFGEPMSVLADEAADALDSRFEALRTTATALVGRDEEINLLMRVGSKPKRATAPWYWCRASRVSENHASLKLSLERLSDDTHTTLRYFGSPHHRDRALYQNC